MIRQSKGDTLYNLFYLDYPVKSYNPKTKKFFIKKTCLKVRDGEEL